MPCIRPCYVCFILLPSLCLSVPLPSAFFLSLITFFPLIEPFPSSFPDESLSNHSDDIDRLFAPSKQDADSSSFFDLSSSGYREGSAFGGDDDDDDDDFWGDAVSTVASHQDQYQDIFSEEEGEGDRAKCDANDGNLTDIFWSSSDESR